jgi:hypothetical protein
MGIFDKVKHAVQDTAHTAKDLVHKANHWSKDLVHKAGKFSQTLDHHLISFTDWSQTVPPLRKLMEQKLPYIGLSSYETCQLIDEGLRDVHANLVMIEKGQNELDNLLDGDTKLQSKIDKLRDMWDKNEASVDKAFEAYHEDYDLQKLRDRLERFVPIVKKGKQVAKELLRKVEDSTSS